MVTNFIVQKLKNNNIIEDSKKEFKLVTHWNCPGTDIVLDFIKNKNKESEGKADTTDATQIIERIAKCTRGNDRMFFKCDTMDIYEDESFDKIQILFTGTSEDDLKHDCDTIITKPKVAEVKEYLWHDDYKVDFNLHKSELSNGEYTFCCGAQDDGWHEDFANISALTINYIKS
ncbi:hypothetical protein [Clostridium weizhouense]|uniref:Uncharacterized protein n=1 Tax=Clostridium weizhouense TaxID=2859781 RepID=A0ABS7AJE9_9CLOT|nr:hypothetical protein [Clostridium weizhouense]MBW6408783.1 hypothetical protein [Clostridium weizhouense]